MGICLAHRRGLVKRLHPSEKQDRTEGICHSMGKNGSRLDSMTVETVLTRIFLEGCMGGEKERFLRNLKILAFEEKKSFAQALSRKGKTRRGDLTALASSEGSH